MNIIFRNFFIILLVFILSACQSSSKNKFQEKNFQVSEVEVQVYDDPKISHVLLKPTESFQGVLTNTISNYVAEYNATRPNANIGYKLKVDITRVHYKNAVMSLLVGDSNHISGNASLVNPNTGEILHTAPVNYVDGASAILNGISGAVLSVVVKKEAAEATLSKGVSKNVMKFIYPNAKISSGSEQRLKDKSVLEPRTSAISSLSRPILEETTVVEAEEPSVITLD